MVKIQILNHLALYHLKDEVALAILPPFERVRYIAFLFSHTAVLLILLILTSNHFWSQHHLLEESGNSFWTSINFGHPNHKTGNLLVWKQNGTCQCYHSRRLGKSLRTPLSQCPAIPGCADRLGFLTERIWTLRQWHYAAPTFLAYVFTSYLSPSTRRFLGKDEKPALVYLNLSKNFHITKITNISRFLRCQYYQV